jgi:drug/metabolite transporter (DMT)-like permease
MAAEDRTGAAAAAILAAMALIGFIDNFVPAIAEEGGLWQFHAMRSAMALALLGGVAALLGWRLRPRRWGAVLARSAFITGAMTLYFASLAVLPIGQAVAGLFTAPIWVLGISVAFLGHRAGPLRLAAVGLGFAGALLVIGVGGAAVEPVAVVPVLAGLLYAVGQIGTRRWCAGEDTTTLLFWFFATIGGVACAGLAAVSLLPAGVAAGAPEAGAFVLSGWVAPSPRFLALTALQAVGSLVAVAFIVRAYQIAEAGRVSVFENALLVFASLWGWLIFGQGVTPQVGAGMALILASAILIARTDRRTAPRRAPA